MTPSNQTAEERIARAEELDRLATPADGYQDEPGYNNGGAPTRFFFVPGHNHEAKVEMMAEDSILIVEYRTLCPALAADAKRAREAVEAERNNVAILRTEMRRAWESERLAELARDQALEQAKESEAKYQTENERAAAFLMRAESAEKTAAKWEIQAQDFRDRLTVAERERDEAKELRGAALDAMDVRQERDRYATLILSMQQTWEALEKAVESKDPDAIAKATSDWSAARSAVLTAKVKE